MAGGRLWSEEEDAWLAEHYADHSCAELSLMMWELGWPRTAGAIRTHADKLRVRKPKFPWNKGVKGYRQRKRGKAAHNRRPLLSTFKRTDNGRHMIKVSPRGSGARNRNEWIDEGKFVWMQHNGMDWPEGHDCWYADGDPDNLSPDNVVPAPHWMAPMLTGGNRVALPWWNKETLLVAMASARLRHETYRHERPDMDGVRQ